MSGYDPPDPGITSTTFNALQAMDYDAGAMAFKNGSVVLYYMFVQRKGTSADVCEWFHDTDAGGGINPRGEIPQLTYDVIKNGTLNTQTQKISYLGKSYRIRVCRDTSSGALLAKAVEV